MKKGAYDLGRKALYYIVSIMIVALVFVYTSSALYKYQQKSFETLSNVEGTGMLNKVDSCFQYEDSETGRVYPNTVNMEKFKQENLEKCTNTPITVKLTKNSGETTISNKADLIKEGKTLRRMTTIKDKGAEEEGLLQVVIAK